MRDTSIHPIDLERETNTREVLHFHANDLNSWSKASGEGSINCRGIRGVVVEGKGGVTNLLKSDPLSTSPAPGPALAATIQLPPREGGELPNLKAMAVFPIPLNRNSLDLFFNRFRLSL